MTPLFATEPADVLRSLGCEFRVLPAIDEHQELLVAIRGSERYLVDSEESMRRLIDKLKLLPR